MRIDRADRDEAGRIVPYHMVLKRLA